MSSTAPASVIHDIGYKPYAGPRLGRAQIVRALYVHSVRSVFGLGRGPKAKIVPWFVIAITMVPAALNVYAASTNREPVLSYAAMGYNLMLFAVLFVAIAAPELVSRDLRHHTLPLYFSRPLRRGDYPLAKLLALFTSLLVVELLPVLVTFLGQVASAKSGHQIWLDTRDAFPAVFVAFFQSALFSSISLLMASATGRRVIATGAIAIFFLVTTAIGHVFSDALGRTWAEHTVSCTEPTVGKNSGAQNLFGFGGGQDGPPTGVVDRLCAGVDLRNDNIEQINGQRDPNRPGYADLTIQYQSPVYSTVAKVGGMLNPVNIVEGTRIWLFDATDGQIPNPSPLGPVYGAETIVLLVAAGGGLFLRYRKVSVS
ncbi:ABC transporter permease subunit [Actinospica sp. MGRD01-02]|uniref:ABC transporter permease subunit n=1 Tax=Actinospica acidithermotolerans TaxID=2828514 RepID=A0A941IJ22_9ACTN|nr:ABC transporter permease subunit [Actinospica acidithermotolerans]MBR7825326.1 ABC transporter permease subunit [Actinospica acidithermotolerans]